MRILIIGGGGFIGSNTADYLLHREYDVRIYTKNAVPAPLNCPYHYGDLLEEDHLGSLLQGMDAVVYLISFTSPQASMENSAVVYSQEIPLLLGVLDACLENGIKRLVYASSGGTVYGNTAVPCSEDQETWPLCHYAVGKLTCEKILFLYNAIYGMENVALRISNPYGRGQTFTGGIGAVTVFAQQIICGKPITVYGDGSVVRDFLDVKYVAQAFEQSILWKFDPQISPVFNIGSGIGISLNQLISMLSDMIGKPAEVNYCPGRPYDVPYSCLDIRKARTVLGYTPPTDLESELRGYINTLMELGGVP